MAQSVDKKTALAFWVLAAGPLGLLLGALGFEHWGGLAPCPLCLLQRGPLLVAALLGGFALVLREAPGVDQGLRVLLALSGLVLAAGALVAVYHAGVERHVFPAPSSCTAVLSSVPLTPEALAAARASAKIIRCDVVPWSLFGLSLADYNILASGGLAALAFWTLRRI